MNRNLSIHISDRSHVNLTLNVYNCGNQDMEIERSLRPDHYQIYYVKEGKGYFTQNQVTHKVQAGQGFVVFPNSDVTIKSEHKRAMNVTWVAFSGYLVERYLGRAKLTIYEPVFEDDAERSIEEILDRLIDVSTKLPNRYCKIMTQMYSLFAFLLDHPRADAQQTSPASPELLLFKALDFIDSNYQDDISVEDIAASAGGTRKTLYAAFKNLTGFSPRDYLIYYRMCRATLLLKNPDLSVETVATSVGYGDQFHFSKEFKKNVGSSPTEYRRCIAQDPSKEYRSPIDVVRQKYSLPQSSIPEELRQTDEGLRCDEPKIGDLY